jgi:hypothetical protein
LSDLVSFVDQINIIETGCSKNYIIDVFDVVKMPLLSQENNAMLIINMIYERQIKRVVEYNYLDDLGRSYLTGMNQDLFVISV